MESDRSNDSEQNGNQENDELRKFEWTLALRRGQRMQRRHFFKRLHDQHKQIEVETNHGADDVDPAPRPREMFWVTRKDRKCEERHRYDAETDGRRKTMEREKESRDRCCHGCDQKPFGPTIETFTADHPEHDDETGENRDETDQRVNDCVDLQDHDDPITSVPGDREVRSGATLAVLFPN
jgi:hypothetical protein